MKTKYSIYSTMLLTILFSFNSCVKDELDIWLDLKADKIEVAVNEEVTFTISGNAETYVIYTGDAGHDFTKSYVVLTEGKKVDQEEYVLTQDSLDIWTPILTAEIEAWNAVTGNAPQDATTIFAGITALVGKSFYKDTATNRLREIMTTFKLYSECAGIVTTYFTNNSVLLAPVEGFSTGQALNRYNLVYTYTYSTPGTYIVTLLGTEVGQKNYTGNGYIDDRTSSASEFDFNRNTATITIVVN